MMLRVVSWLWSDPNGHWNDHFRYGPEHVNILRNMVRRNLRMDHEFVCITDDPEGIDPDIRIVPLWDDLRHLGGCYVRLKAFSEEMVEIIGERFVWMDVDCVVTGDLTPLFDRPEDIVLWRNKIGPTPYCGSMVLMTAGARKQVWETFNPLTSPMAKKGPGYIGTDQAWISLCLKGEAAWTPDDGVLSRYHALPRDRLDVAHREWMGDGTLPEHARVVFFHGPQSPCQMTDIDWIANHWR